MTRRVRIGEDVFEVEPREPGTGTGDRFVGNRVVRTLLRTSKLTLNELGAMYLDGLFSQREYVQFYAALGYSLDGFCELSSLGFDSLGIVDVED